MRRPCKDVYTSVNNIWTFPPASFTFSPRVGSPKPFATAFHSVFFNGHFDLTKPVEKPENKR